MNISKLDNDFCRINEIIRSSVMDFGRTPKQVLISNLNTIQLISMNARASCFEGNLSSNEARVDDILNTLNLNITHLLISSSDISELHLRNLFGVCSTYFRLKEEFES